LRALNGLQPLKEAISSFVAFFRSLFSLYGLASEFPMRFRG
jgi:hypothetical protein